MICQYNAPKNLDSWIRCEIFLNNAKFIKYFGRYLFDIPGISILNNLPSFGGNWIQYYKIEMDWYCDEKDKK